MDEVRVIPTRAHGALDYLVGLVLIAAPWIFQFNDVESAKWTAIGVGAAMIVSAAMTNYELGLVRLIPMHVHLVVDAAPPPGRSRRARRRGAVAALARARRPRAPRARDDPASGTGLRQRTGRESTALLSRPATRVSGGPGRAPALRRGRARTDRRAARHARAPRGRRSGEASGPR